jgi:hypothetical protein
MSQQIINVGTTPNDGAGTPIRTAFQYTNNNFAQLFALPNSSPPVTLLGKQGDIPGMYAFNSNFFYYCFATYNGINPIWAEVAQSSSFSDTIVNGTSNVLISTANGNVAVTVGNVANVAVFSTTGVSLSGNVHGNYILGNGSQLTGVLTTSGDISTSGNVTGSYILGNGSQLSGLPATYANSNVASYLQVLTSNISTTGNITGSYIFGNASQMSGLPPTYGNANVANYLPIYSGLISSGNLFVTNQISTLGNIDTTGNISTTGNVLAQGYFSAAGNVITAGYFIGNFQGNVTGNFTVPGSNTQVLFNNNGNAGASAGITYNSGSNTFIVLGIISAQGNVLAGNILSTGVVSATGNITGNYIIGNGSQLTGLPATYGNSQVANYLPTFSGNLTAGNISVSGNIISNGLGKFGNLSVVGTATDSGNISAGNLLTLGVVSASGNVTGNFILGNGSLLTGLPATYGNANVANYLPTFSGNLSSGNISVLGNIGGGNIIGSGILSITLTATTGNLVSNGYISATGNVSTGNVIASGIASITQTITGGNIVTNGYVTAVGNITGNYILGNGSQLTGISTNPSNINLGTSNVSISAANANATVSINGTSNVIVWASTGQYVTGLISATGNITGAAISGSSVSVGGNVTGASLIGTIATASQTTITSVGTLGSLSVQGNATSGNILTDGLVSATGSIAGGAITGSSLSVSGTVTGSSLTGTLSTASQTNITAVGTLSSLSVSGTITVNSTALGTGIINGAGSAVGNIGSSSDPFNIIYAQSTSAQYADLAENYLADAFYFPGTVVSFGGPNEVTFSTVDQDPAVAGVVSTSPAYQMNSGLKGEYVTSVALIGRVPCQVQGPVRKGSLMVSAGNGIARAEINPKPGTIIGKALETFNGNIGTIEIVVGRL